MARVGSPCCLQRGRKARAKVRRGCAAATLGDPWAGKPLKASKPHGRYRDETREGRRRSKSPKPWESARAARKPALASRRCLDSPSSSDEGAKNLGEAVGCRVSKLASKHGKRPGLGEGTSKGQRIPGEMSNRWSIDNRRGRSEHARGRSRETESPKVDGQKPMCP
jgi:hypothetical protein